MAALRAGLPVKKQENEQKKSHFFVYSRRATHDIPTIFGMVIEEVRTIFAPLTFFDPISRPSFGARGY